MHRRTLVAAPETSGVRRGRIIRNKCDDFSFGSHAPGAAGPVQMGFPVFRLVIIYNKPYILYVEAAGSDIGRD